MHPTLVILQVGFAVKLLQAWTIAMLQVEWVYCISFSLLISLLPLPGQKFCTTSNWWSSLQGPELWSQRTNQEKETVIFLILGPFDTEDNLTPRTIWHRGQFDTIMASRTIWHHEGKEDNLTPRTIWHRGQFDTIMQNRTIWHWPCQEDNLTPRTIWHRGQFDTIINFIFLQLFGPQIWLEIYWLPLSIFLTENYPV